jgi:hypothetical protein
MGFASSLLLLSAMYAGSPLRASADSAAPTSSGANFASAFPAGGLAPNVSLHFTNGSVTLYAKLWYNESTTQFSVNAAIWASGGHAPYTLRVAWGISGSWDWSTSNASANTSFSTSTVYNETGSYPFFAEASDSVGNGSYVNATIRAIAPASQLFLTAGARDVQVNGSWTTDFQFGPPQGGMPNYTLLLSFGDGGAYNTTLGLGSSGTTYHTYTASGCPAQFSVTFRLIDARRASGFSNFTVSPSYLCSGNSSGGSGCGPGGAQGTCTFLNATSGSLHLAGELFVASSTGPSFPLSGWVNLTGGVAPYSFQITYGDGGTNSVTNSSGVNVSFSHTYTASANPTYENWSVSANEANGQNLSPVFAFALLTLSPSNSSSNSSGNQSTSSTRNCGNSPNATCIWLGGTSGPLSYALTLLLNHTAASPYPLVGNGSVAGGSAPYLLIVNFGDGYGLNQSLGSANNSTAAVFQFHHGYPAAGNYSFSFTVYDANRSSATASTWLSVGFWSNGSGNVSPPHPTPVSVVVVASPVTGVAPLLIDFSALIDGGSAPFSVVWSLPDGNGTVNATGLATSLLYTVAGWFPATAFVYNTTNAYGTVLVGYGSVWVYLTSPGNGSGSGNQSELPDTSHHAPVSTTGAGGMGLGPSTEFGLLLATALGAIVGAGAGFLLARRGRKAALSSDATESPGRGNPPVG